MPLFGKRSGLPTGLKRPSRFSPGEPTGPTRVSALEVIQDETGITRIEGFLGDSPEAMGSIGSVFGPSGDWTSGTVSDSGEAQVFQFNNSSIEGRFFKFIVRKCVSPDAFATFRAFPLNSQGFRIPNAVAPPPNPLIAFYPFSENANDVSGNNRHGIVNGASLTRDRFNCRDSAYAFFGNQNIEIPVDLFTGTEGSISLWFQNNEPITGVTGSASIFPFFAFEQSVNDATRFILLSVGDFTSVLDGEILGVAVGTGPQNPVSAVAASRTGMIPPGWHHFVLKSGPAGHSYYFDGIQYLPDLMYDGISPASNVWPLNAARAMIGGIEPLDGNLRSMPSMMSRSITTRFLTAKSKPYLILPATQIARHPRSSLARRINNQVQMQIVKPQFQT